MGSTAAHPFPAAKTGRAVRLFVLVLAVALGLVAVASVGKASWEAADRKGMDYGERWQELRYFLRGTDPNALFPELRVLRELGIPEPAARAAAGLDPELGLARRPFPVGVYPPWTYAMTAPLGAFEDVRVGRTAFALLNAALFVAVGLWCLREARRHLGVSAAVLVAAMCMSIAAFRVNAMVGNYALLALTLLVGMRVALARDRPVLGGFLFGLAMFKPVLSGPFVFVFLLRRSWWAGAVVATLTVLAACAAFAWWTGENPLASFRHTQDRLGSFPTIGFGLMELVAPVFEGAEGQRAWSALVLATGTLVLVLNRRAPLDVHFAICAVTALLWTFHRRYDQTLLVFVMLCAVAELVRHARAGGPVAGTAWRVAGIALLWASAFLPVWLIRYYDVKFAIELYWPLLLGALLVAGRASRQRTVRAPYTERPDASEPRPCPDAH